MFVLSFVTILGIMLIAQLNPSLAVGDSFFMADPNLSGEVKGIIDINDRQEKIISHQTDIGLLSPPQAVQLQAPIKKDLITPAPTVTANSAVIFDTNSRKILYEKNGDEIVSIASLTKLMTALVVLDQDPDFAQEYMITKEDRVDGGRIFLFPGDVVTLGDLLNISLVGSANTATLAMVHALGMVETDFVSKMNTKAAQMGLRKTTFIDSVGLDPHTTSTAYELIEIAIAAFAQPKIKQAVLSDQYTFTTKQGRKRTVESTDSLLKFNKNYQILGGKTGYIDSAGFCFIGKFQNQAHRQEIVSVLLGSFDIKSRFAETDALVRWVYDSYVWLE